MKCFQCFECTWWCLGCWLSWSGRLKLPAAKQASCYERGVAWAGRSLESRDSGGSKRRRRRQQGPWVTAAAAGLGGSALLLTRIRPRHTTSRHSPRVYGRGRSGARPFNGTLCVADNASTAASTLCWLYSCLEAATRRAKQASSSQQPPQGALWEPRAKAKADFRSRHVDPRWRTSSERNYSTRRTSPQTLWCHFVMCVWNNKFVL